MTRTIRTAALLAGSALALAACATDRDESDTASASTQTSASASTSEPMDDMTPAPAPSAGGNPTVGGAEMLPTRNIVENASNSSVHTTLVSAVQAAGLVQTLSGPGPFTVFAPTNTAFTRLPAGTLDTLLQPANKATLTRVLTYHVVPGAITAADLQQRIQAGGGTATLTTVEGGTLTASLEGSAVKLTDANGNVSYVSQADVRQSNGIINVVNGVLTPKLG